MDNKKIRIALIMGKMNGGGVEAVTLNYFKFMNKENIKVDFFIDEDSTYVPHDEIKEIGGNIVIIPPYQKLFRYIKTLKNKLKGNYDIVHSNINALSVFPLYAAKKAGVKVRIAHSHSTSNKKEWKKNIIKNMLRPFSKKYATHFFACSELAARWLFGNKTVDKGLVTIIYNAIDLDKFKFDLSLREKIRKQLKIENDFVVGHVGRFMKQKNHSFLIDIFYEIQKLKPNSKLLLCGSGPLEEDIRQKVANLGIEHKVTFLGQVDNPHEIYQAMDIFVLPSLYEGLGMVLIEAQACGLHCFASTEVPQEANVTDDVRFIQLKDQCGAWSDAILNSEISINRENSYIEIKNSKYDIYSQSSGLFAIYQNLYANT